MKLELKAKSLRQNQFPDTNFTANIVVNNELTPVLVDISTPPAAYQLLHLYSK
jgi:iron complex outermembrane receptor protein